MTATTTDRNTRQRPGIKRAFPMAAATLIPAGVIACLNASGLLVNGATSATLKCVGVTQKAADNSAGLASAINGEVETGVFGPFANSASTDQITLTEVGSDCYIVDNQTLAKTSNSAARSVAGKVWDVDTEGVWLKVT
ncbi:MAG: hypothetical protein ACSLE9_06775 [Burkholderiaceae bacterium]